MPKLDLTELNRLAELSEKATQGEWSPSNDGYTAIEDKDGNVLYYDEGTATTENNELICTLVNFFRASLPALREAARQKEIDPNIEEYIANLSWTPSATEHEIALVVGNIRGFYNWLMQHGTWVAYRDQWAGGDAKLRGGES